MNHCLNVLAKLLWLNTIDYVLKLIKLKLVLTLRESLQDNAALYFDQSKRFRKKGEGAQRALSKLQVRIDKLSAAKERKSAVAPKKRAPRRRGEWYESFRWFTTSDGLLCVGGRDAATNEIVIKKHTESTDLVFHTTAPGSPFFVLKTKGKAVPSDASVEEAAIATVSFSRAWRMGLASFEVFYVKPAQLSKEAPAGEYVSRGAFMVRGKRTTRTVPLQIAVGLRNDGRIMSGPLAAVKAHCTKHVLIKSGKGKATDLAKRIIKQLGSGTVDEVLRTLPGGGSELA